MSILDKINKTIDVAKTTVDKAKESNLTDIIKESSKLVGNKAKEAVKDGQLKMEAKIEQNKIIKQESKALSKLFKPDIKSDNLQIDSINKLFKINNGKIYNFNDLLDFELLEDDITITKGGLGLAAVGAVTFNAAGAIVGSIAGKKTTKKKCDKLILKISLNDYDKPCVLINYISKPVKTTDKEYTRAFNSAHKNVSLLEIVYSKNQKGSIEINNDSNIEQLKQLKELLDLEIITQEEFELKKKQLLNI